MNNEARIQFIRAALEREFTPQRLEIIDDSHLHAGHASAGGGGHFRIDIVADAFRGRKPLERHRMIYRALQTAMENNEIHALSIQARTSDETN